jgi:hypothetical protein
MAAAGPALKRLPGLFKKSEEAALHDPVLQFAGDLFSR